MLYAFIAFLIVIMLVIFSIIYADQMDSIDVDDAGIWVTIYLLDKLGVPVSSEDRVPYREVMGKHFVPVLPLAVVVALWLTGKYLIEKVLKGTK